MTHNIEVSLENNNEFSAFLTTMIREFNNEQSIYHKESRKKNAVQPINIMVWDDEKQWIGGITAEVYWNWLEINKFWLSERFRRKGLGHSLLEKTEKIAKEKGAIKAMLTTFEFQARSFYEQHGYKIVGEVKDYPPGSCYYTMVKSL